MIQTIPWFPRCQFQCFINEVIELVFGKVNKFLKSERGTQMLEFAFLLPFLLLFFAGTVEIGRMFYTYTTLSKTTEVGARYLSTKSVSAGAYASTDTSAATNLVVCGNAASCTSGQTPVAQNLAAGNVTITAPGTGTGTRYVTVKVTYAYQPLVFNLSHLTGVSSLSLNFTFNPSTTMRYML
jgi:Flp pilus assembly protein TadG